MASSEGPYRTDRLPKVRARGAGTLCQAWIGRAKYGDPNRVSSPLVEPEHLEYPRRYNTRPEARTLPNPGE